MAQTTTSSTGTLNKRDFLRGLLIAVITTPFTIIIQTINAGSFTFDWKAIVGFAIVGGLSYITKNLFEPGKIIVPATKEEIKSVNEGESKAVITKQ